MHFPLLNTLLTKLETKLEHVRLERRYTRRANRTTFTSTAQYIDGEYVYTSSPTNEKSAVSSEGRRSSCGSNRGGSGNYNAGRNEAVSGSGNRSVGGIDGQLGFKGPSVKVTEVFGGGQC